MKKTFKIVPVFIPMLGCKHKCVFCNQNVITGHSDSAYAEIMSQIKDGMAYIDKEEPCDEVAFFGGSFTCLPVDFQKRVLGLAKPYIEQDLARGIRVSTRPDYINPSLLKLLKNSHVTTIELGIQSTNDQVLKHSDRGHGSSCVFDSARLIKKKGFSLGLQMMIGLPKDTVAESLKSAKDMISLKPNFVRIYPTLVLKGSYLEHMLRDGRYKPLALDEAIDQVCLLRMLFEYNGINVIRTGLQANEELDLGTGYLQGPYHPAFGELVENDFFYRWFVYILQHCLPKDIKTIKLIVNPKDLSKAIGQKKFNTRRLATTFPLKEVTIGSDISVPQQQLIASWNNKSYNMNRKDFIKKQLSIYRLL